MSQKTIFLKSDKIGEGELGAMLIQGFLGAILEQEETLKSIVCVNSAVLLTTSENEDIINIFKALEEKGVKIYSCGTCLDYYKIRENLKVGVVGNAMDTTKALLTEDIIYL